MNNKILVGSNFTNKNRIINGGFNVWQRGESFTFTTGQSGYTADRIKTQNATDGQFTVSKSSINEKNSVKITVDSPPTDLTLGKYWYGFTYIFEGQHLYDLAMNGENVTISFWLKSNVTGTYNISLRNITDTSTGVQSYVAEFNYITADTPQKIEVIIPLNYTWNPALQNDENRGFILTIGFLNQGDYVTSTTNQWQEGSYLTTPNCVNWGATAGNYIEIAQLQLEKGSYATEFEVVPYDIELMRCMRYYEFFEANMDSYIGNINNSYTITYVPKRCSPSILLEVLYTSNTSLLAYFEPSIGNVSKNRSGRYRILNNGVTGNFSIHSKITIDAEL